MRSLYRRTSRTIATSRGWARAYIAGCGSLLAPTALASLGSWQPHGIRAVCIRLSALALLVVLASCGDARDEPLPDSGGAPARLEIRGQPAVLISPAQPTGKVVVYTHGSGETIDSIFRAGSPMRPIFTRLLRAGYALAASAARGNNWGNSESERDYLALVGALRERALRDVYVLALSMGGFNGLQLLEHVRVRAWAGIFVACDMASIDALGLYSGDIRAAYGLGREDPTQIATRGRSPVAVHARPGLPMRFWASPGDRVVPKRRNTDACAGLARRRGARATVTTTRGDHADPSNFDAAGVLRLFESAGP